MIGHFRDYLPSQSRDWSKMGFKANQTATKLQRKKLKQQLFKEN